MHFSQSDLVRVRRAQWRVADVCEYAECRLVTLEGLDASNSGLIRRVLAPFDFLESVRRGTRPVRVPRRVWRRACRALLAAHTPPGALHTARGARIDLLPHQLEPALALVRGHGSRVLLADDVGLGKTVQAGLIMSELRAIGAASRVLIVTPAGLRDQWADELLARFGIEARVLDASALRRLLAELPVGVNPWASAPIAIASVDLLKRPEVLAAACGCHWDVVVVDEAHGVAGDTERHAAVAALAERSAFVVLMTATPHSGDRRTFASLCGLGARVEAGQDDDLLIFRRSREDVRLGTKRRIHRLLVRLSADELHVHTLLQRFGHAVRLQQHGHRADWGLALAVLHKRALSSARSLKESVERRLAAMSGTDMPSQARLPFKDFTGELTGGDEPPEWSPLLALEDSDHERRLLGELAGAAGRAARQETKIGALARLLRRVAEPAIVFTEYRDTLLHVEASLGVSSTVLHGGMGRQERRAALDRFMRGEARLLLATDAAGEGINLQRTCRLVVNLELPWNPMRLEQRIGRVDRIGQQQAVHVVHLIARDSPETTILRRLHERGATARFDVGGSDPLGLERENEIARLVTGAGARGRAEVPPSTALPSGLSVRWPSLAADGVAEAKRNASARVYSAPGDERALARAETLGPLTTRARRWETRARLAGRVCFVWRLVAESPSGRHVGSSILASVADAWTPDTERRAGEAVAIAAQSWQRAIASGHQQVLKRRLAREEGTNTPPLRAAFQPGLFERRAERSRMAAAVSDRTAEQDRAERITAIKRALPLSFPPPQLLLVLMP
jgi:superfamily II DNA or RNA helicase